MVKNEWIMQQKQEEMLQKLLLKELFKKTAKATGDLIENKIANKITSVGKTKNKEKEDKTNEVEQIYIPPEKHQKIIDDLRLLQMLYKNRIPKNYKPIRQHT